nr:sulfatase [Luteolibacter marinus]
MFLFALLTLHLGAAERPNILLLFADDLGRYASAYADPQHPSPNDVIRTPAFDRIAASGARFDNAFVSAPSCTPSRGSLYTGRHFFRNGSASQLHNPWQGDAPDPFATVTGMPNTLAAAGYHIGWSHKWHLRESLIGGKSNEYSPRGGRINQFSQVVSKAPDPAAAKAAILDEVRGNFRAFLAKRKEGQPFFYSFNPTNTHRKWIRGSGKALWGLDPERLKGKLPPFLPDNPVFREDFADYLGEAMAFDAACGVILDELEALGESSNTLVCISGDHGAPGFPRGKCNVHDFGSRVLLGMSWPGRIAAGRVVGAPVSLVDIAPTFLAAAGLESKDEPNGESLLPALAAGGSDAALRGWALIGREVHVRGARDTQLPYPVRALRTADFLYVRNFKPDRTPMGDPPDPARDMPNFNKLANDTYAAYADIDASPAKAWLVRHRDEPDVKPFLAFAWEKRPAEELYDLRTDPFQMHNLAGDNDHQGKLSELAGRLMRELNENHDPRLQDDFDRAPYLAPK